MSEVKFIKRIEEEGECERCKRNDVEHYANGLCASCYQYLHKLKKSAE